MNTHIFRSKTAHSQLLQTEGDLSVNSDIVVIKFWWIQCYLSTSHPGGIWIRNDTPDINSTTKYYY